MDKKQLEKVMRRIQKSGPLRGVRLIGLPLGRGWPGRVDGVFCISKRPKVCPFYFSSKNR